MLNEVLNLYRDYAVIPFIILAIVIVGYIIIIEKFILLQVIYKINFIKFNEQIRKMLSANDLDRAKNLCLATSKTGIPRIAIRAIDTYEEDPMKVRAVLSEESLRFFPRIRRRITQLPNLAAGCVLLGAIAAINGAWFSFQMVESLELGIKSFAFSQGLGDALIPLSLSLIAALLLIVPYGLLDSVAWRLESEMEHSLCVIINILCPEIVPMLAQGSVPMANTTPENPPMENRLEAENTISTENANKGTAQDVAAAKTEELPDEEEII